MSTTMRAPDPALLDAAVPALVAAGAGGRTAAGDGEPEGKAPAAATAAGDGAGGEEDAAHGTLRLGPITISTAGTQLLFKARQRFRVSDKVRASVGAFYSFKDDRIGPTASLTYLFDGGRSRVEIDERRAFVKKRWTVGRGNLSLGLGAECSVTHTGLPPGARPRPELHLSLDHIKPLKWEAIGVGLVLLANLPFALRDKEVERPTFAPRLLGFARSSLRRTGYAAFTLNVGELSAVLDL